ncbi:hypothetical protein L4D06_13760 [Enterovibrio makurazakiensis]|uniref:Uncharacterized protein n=1 Tax=Enterovibrio gelatinilyticus TaxID=2899819 RepID=A0ABT5R070_9GAMM|nr:hypothetical protein [Enterovibrio sp. ZSDZ42]MDD1793673.1 hypothetical protein [Enterovibrio sp. ZSDZ42]
MNQARAENLYYFLRKQNTPQAEINTVIERLLDLHGIDLKKLDLHYRMSRGYSPNRYDINTYGGAGSRTMNQTRQMQRSER